MTPTTTAPATARPGRRKNGWPSQSRTSRPGRARKRWPRRERWTLTGLLVLTAVPVLAGGARLGELASDPTVTEANARFVTMPAPVVVHIVTATVFSILGALQLMPAYRRNHLRRHRLTGRVVAPAGLLAALTGLWMTLWYDLPSADDGALTVVRLVAGTAMAATLVLGVVAAVRRRIPQHRAWMIRGYALGLAAGTQVLTSLPLLATGADPTDLTRTASMTAGWVLNGVVAEVVIRRGARPRRRQQPDGGREPDSRPRPGAPILLS